MSTNNNCTCSPEEVHINDIGTIFRATINDCQTVDGVDTLTPLDISTATTKEIIFKKPDGDVITKTADFTTDGTDGKIQYVTISNDLDQVGNWKLQAYIVLPSGSWRSNIVTFRVYENL